MQSVRLPKLIGLGRGASARPPVSPSTGGRLVYAVGDVHGQADLLERLLAHIFRDALATPQRARPVLIFLGDLIDRGTASRQVLDIVLQLQAHRGIQVIALRGNHEQALLDFLRQPKAHGGWLDHGGLDTLASYGVDPGPDLVQVREDLLQALPGDHLRLLRDTRLYASIADYAFVHAGVRAGLPLERQAARDLLWIREPFLDGKPRGYGQVVVHGHTPGEATVRPHRIGVDTGAYFTGRLTCVRLHGTEQRFIQATQ